MNSLFTKTLLSTHIKAALLASSAILLTACGGGAGGAVGDTGSSPGNISNGSTVNSPSTDSSNETGSTPNNSNGSGTTEDSSNNENSTDTNNSGNVGGASNDSSSESDSSNTQTCNDFILGANYSLGDVVTHNGNTYQCLQVGWCSSSAAWAYEPGIGSYWEDAWELVGGSSCATTNSGLENESSQTDSNSENSNGSSTNTSGNGSSGTGSSDTSNNGSSSGVGALCESFNVYPDFPEGSYANGGDIMVYENIAYQAKYYASSIPGSDDSWEHYLNCDGTQKGEALRLSIQNRKDPVSLKVAGWPSYLEIASKNNAANSVITTNAIDLGDLSDYNKLVNHYEALISTARNAGSTSVILNGALLDEMIANSISVLQSVDVVRALEDALVNTGSYLDISSESIQALSNNLQGFAESHNLIMATLAPNATFGWSLNLSGEFVYANHSGRESVWDDASKATASLLDKLGVYLGNHAADFVSFYRQDKVNESRLFSDEEWYNALMYVQQVTDFVDAPALLWDLPTDSATINYFFGQNTAERQLRHAAYSNVFAALFNQHVSQIDAYSQATIPLYYTGASAASTPLTGISSLNAELASLEYTMNNEVFLYELPAGNQWAPSTLYKWNDFLTALNSMHNVGVAGDTFWLVDPSADAATNAKYAKVAIAAFLSQSMQETIRYDACDENNWAQVKYGAPTDYPMTASCGQLGQQYSDYGVNPVSGKDNPYSCPRNAKMELTASTHAKWYGAPAPLFVAPDAVLQEKGLLVNGSVGRWDHAGGHCNDVPDRIDESKQAYDRENCKVYEGQKAGGFVWDGSSQGSVQGCGWWGRGVIQTTGRQNFGTLNHFVGRSHVDPSTIGQTIDGVTVEAAPEQPLFADLDLCSNPGLVCSSEEHSELKWVAGLFFWVTSVQAYENAGGPYEGWDYYEELKAYVDGGLVGTSFVDAVSGIVNRGCPDDHCPVSGEVHAIDERRANFKLALQKMGLDPR